MNALETRDLTFAYQENPERHVICDMSFRVEQGAMVVLIGDSGSGKSTLCQILCGILPGTIQGELQGQVYFQGQDITHTPLCRLAEKIGYVMQDPDRQMIATTVEDELAFGLENLCIPADQICQRVEEIMDILQISELRNRTPGTLSGGEKQVVAIGAILSMNPDMILLDEPLSHLDVRGKETVCAVIRKLKEQGTTLLIVEHDYDILDFADQWMFIEGGRIVKKGSPAQLLLEGGPF